jgi:hypothetical protein
VATGIGITPSLQNKIEGLGWRPLLSTRASDCDLVKKD